MVGQIRKLIGGKRCHLLDLMNLLDLHGIVWQDRKVTPTSRLFKEAVDRWAKTEEGQRWMAPIIELMLKSVKETDTDKKSELRDLITAGFPVAHHVVAVLNPGGKAEK